MAELVLVTGSSGFVGRALVAHGRAQGARILGVGRAPPSHSTVEEDYLALDLAGAPGPLEALLGQQKPAVIFHLAGGAQRGVDPFVANVVPMRRLLQAIAAVPGYSPRLVSIGSAAEYGDLGQEPIREEARERPVSEYGIAKLAQTRLCLIARRRGLRVLVARPFNLVGPGMSADLAPARFARAARAAAASGERFITTGDLSPLRDYLDIEDAAQALWQLGTGTGVAGGVGVGAAGGVGAAATGEPEIVNVCSGQGISMGQILEEILGQLHLSLEVRTDPALVRGTLDIAVSIGDPGKLAAVTGLRPGFDLSRSVARLLGWA